MSAIVTAGDDILTGSDFLDDVAAIRGLVGADKMSGGKGNDTYFIDNIGDKAIEVANGGDDKIFSSISITALAANVEDVALLGSLALNATGNSLNNDIEGNRTDNKLDGGAGNDNIDGEGGNDNILGGDGGDDLEGNQGDDIIDGGAGNDDLEGDSGNDTLIGGAGNDDLEGDSGNDTLIGGAGNDELEAGDGDDTMSGGLGDDQYDVDSVNDKITELANQGIDEIETDNLNIDLGLAAFLNIENIDFDGALDLNGKGNGLDNILNGNDGKNKLEGLDGNDKIDGGLGVDDMRGGKGNDTYLVDDAADFVDENVGQGKDKVLASVTFQLGGNREIEELVLVTGAGNIDGTGNEIDNTITGNEGDNKLSGGAGKDTLSGGTGNDTYTLAAGDAVDKIVEAANAGIDTVLSAIDVTLGANLENLTLAAGSGALKGTGNSLANTMTANDGASTLDGGAGNDTLQAVLGNDILLGGAGNDTLKGDGIINGNRMEGGVGNDTYFMTASDVVVEAANAGIDTLVGDGFFQLFGTLANFENVTIVGSSAGTAIGNQAANVLKGDQGSDFLVGNGGNDTLEGGKAGDSLSGGEDNDILRGGDGEDGLSGGDGNDTLEGGSDNDTLFGEAGNDKLDGGTGNDTMTGGEGNDTYLVDNAADKVSEDKTGGIDTILATVSYELSKGVTGAVEKLILDGSKNIDGTGDGLDNQIFGNVGQNILDGGAGNDTLTGGGGNDTYVVDSLGDKVVELANQGFDTVETGITLTLAANIEKLELTGLADIDGTGNALNNILSGNGGKNKLDGGAGNDELDGGNDKDFLLGAAGNDQLFGADEDDTLDGGAGNDLLDGGTGKDTMTGGAGNDEYVVDSLFDTVMEAKNGGIDTIKNGLSFIDLTVSGTGFDLNNVENVVFTGSAAASGKGNALANAMTGTAKNDTLLGGDGNDRLDGGDGDDDLNGGKGDDTFLVDSAFDEATEAAGEGKDLVLSSVTFTLGAEVENLTLLDQAKIDGTGNTGANVITGNDADNVLDGGGGNDTLLGGLGDDTLNGGTEKDAMTGGTGDDTYFVDDVGDKVTEASKQGLDTVQSVITIAALAVNVENLTLTGAAAIDGTGNTLDNTITGNAQDNVLSGGGGNDTLAGGGGTDTLKGGAGNDIYLLIVGNEITVELANQGTDELRAAVSVNLSDPRFKNIENLTRTSATDGILIGNELNNLITGNAGKDRLEGLNGNDTLDGGASNDEMFGGAGDDTYLVDNVNDKVTELASEGKDAVIATVTFTLANEVENLTLTGNGSINGTGNKSANIITGSEKGNTLNGADGNDTLIGNGGDDTLDGGAGKDAMAGGLANDTYIVDDAGDKVTEAASSGKDEVKSSITFILGANLEDLTLTGGGDINGTGNTFGNVIKGNAGNNSLAGLAGDDVISDTGGTNFLDGGAGNDDLTGGTGTDALFGDVGNDTLRGSAGDSLEGGLGDDVYVVDTSSLFIIEGVNKGTDVIVSSVTFDLSTSNGFAVEHLQLTGLNVNGTGNELNNDLLGSAGDNILSGGKGNDLLAGFGGDDTLSGGDNDDFIEGDDGEDTMTGGAGNDVFGFQIQTTLSALDEDTITDFEVGKDTVDFSFLFRQLDIVSDDAVEDGFLVLETSGGNTLVKLDADGSAGAGTAITLVTLIGVTNAGPEVIVF